MKVLKSFIFAVFLIGIFAAVYIFKNDISKYVVENFIVKKDVIVTSPNNYYKSSLYEYIEITDNFYPETKNDLLKIFYTIINKGWKDFTFYCADSYSTCIDDVKEITNSKETISNLNNFVHPFNTYKKLQIELNGFGKITVHVERVYKDEDIAYVNQKIDEIITNNITSTMTDEEKIKVFHDYIANNTKYDSEEAALINNNEPIDNIESYKATNVLKNGLGLCGGYTDTLAIYLERLGIKNYKISNDKHIWNFLYINDGWYHIDLTWDDPVTTDGSNKILYDFFLITTKQLDNLNTNEHIYDKNVYLEAN